MADESRRGTDWTADELDAIIAAYGILSVDARGNERALSDERAEAFRLYRLYQFTMRPRLFALAPPLDIALSLEPLIFKASLTS